MPAIHDGSVELQDSLQAYWPHYPLSCSAADGFRNLQGLCQLTPSTAGTGGAAACRISRSLLGTSSSSANPHQRVHHQSNFYL